MKSAFLGMAAMATAIPAPASAQDSPGLAPSSSWILDYADDSCALQRMFGEGDNQVFLEFRRFRPTFTLQTTIATNSMTARDQPAVKYRFNGDQNWRENPAVTLATKTGFSGVVFDASLVNLVSP